MQGEKISVEMQCDFLGTGRGTFQLCIATTICNRFFFFSHIKLKYGRMNKNSYAENRPFQITSRKPRFFLLFFQKCSYIILKLAREYNGRNG